MKNKCLIMALSISFLLVLSSCGQPANNPSSNTADQSAASDSEELTQTPPPEPTDIPYSLPPRKAITPENVTQIEILHKIKIPGFLKSEHETCGVDIQSERMLAAVACKTKAVMVWDLETGEVWKRIYVGEIVNTVAFSPDGKF